MARVRVRRALIGLVAGLGLAFVAAPAASAAVCPGTVDEADFATKAELRELVTQENSFGQRFLGSHAHDRTIDWIKDEIRSIDDDFEVRTGPYEIYSWLPRTKASDRPGLDLSRAGGLSVIGADGSETKLPDAGAVRFSQPTGKTGQTGELVYLPREQEITAANSAGKVIVRDFPANSIPLVGLQHHRRVHHPRPRKPDRQLRAPVRPFPASGAACRKPGRRRRGHLRLRPAARADRRLRRSS